MAVKPQIKWVGSPNFGYPVGEHGRNGYKPVAICHHLMEGSLAGTDSWFASAKSKASTTFGIGKNGDIHQYVSLDDSAWGNGLMQDPDLTIPWLAKCWNDNVNPNFLTVSIEFEGAHPKDTKGNVVGFYEFTEAQIQAGIALDAWLCEQYGITPSRQTIIGHSKIDKVSRANCPGPKFPFDRVIAALQPKPKYAPIRVKLPTGRTIYGEVREGDRTWVETAAGWVPLRAPVELLGATVTFLNDHDGVVVSLPQEAK